MIFNKFARVLRNILLRKNIETYSIQCMEFHALNLCKLIVIAEYVWRWAGWIFSGHEKSLQVKHLFTLFKLAFGLEKKSSGSGSALLLFECTFIFFECWRIWTNDDRSGSRRLKLKILKVFDADPDPDVDPDPNLILHTDPDPLTWYNLGMGCLSRIRNPGSGMFIPDTQHWF
jgi:hypothetical protein